MKVVGSGAPRMLTVRLKPCEVSAMRDELRERRAVITDAAARTGNGTGQASADDHEAERHHDELFLITGLLDQLLTAPPQGQARELVGPTWLLAPIIRGAAGEAVDRFAAAVREFREDRGTPTPDELRAAADTAGAMTATLIGLDHVENHAVDRAS